MASGLLQGRDDTVSSQGGVVETQVYWLSSFSVTAEQKNVCGSSLGVTVSSMQRTKTTESTAIDNKPNKLTTLCVCVVLATVILAVTLAD